MSTVRHYRSLLAATLLLTLLGSTEAQTPRPFKPVTAAELLQPVGTEWLTYHGDYSARHYTPVAQINRKTVARLKRAWISQQHEIVVPPSSGPQRGPPPELFSSGPTPVGAGRTGTARNSANTVRSIPLMRDGVLYFTMGVRAYAVDARTGAAIWEYVGRIVSGLSNRGLALSGDTLFMLGNGGLIAIDAATGRERWTQSIGGPVPATAPLVVGKHVYVASGSDGGTGRSWLESRNVESGERQWIWYATPRRGEPGAETWPDESTAAMGAGTPWQTPAYDPQLNLLYFGTGNPYPMKDGRTRPGDNLWTSSIVALNADTGKLVWHFQMTPHDDHDYDGNQVTMLFDARIGGVTRHLLGLVGRNSFLFVVDRTTGKSVTTAQLYDSMNWSRFVRPDGTPEPDPAKSPSPAGVLVSPSSEGSANYPASAYSPQTGLMYANVANSWSMFYTSGETIFGDFRNSLRAYHPVTGKTIWSHDYPEPYGVNARYPGVLATGGGLVFSGDVSGNVVAFDARNGEILWHDELPETLVMNAPMSYLLDGAQYVVVGSGDRLVAYTLQ
jgi:alcohol dehydrogenase (cytochrome c)